MRGRAQQRRDRFRARVNEATPAKWRKRFAADRLDGFMDAARSGAARTIGDGPVGTASSADFELEWG